MRLRLVLSLGVLALVTAGCSDSSGGATTIAVATTSVDSAPSTVAPPDSGVTDDTADGGFASPTALRDAVIAAFDAGDADLAHTIVGQEDREFWASWIGNFGGAEAAINDCTDEGGTASCWIWPREPLQVYIWLELAVHPGGRWQVTAAGWGSSD